MLDAVSSGVERLRAYMSQETTFMETAAKLADAPAIIETELTLPLALSLSTNAVLLLALMYLMLRTPKKAANAKATAGGRASLEAARLKRGTPRELAKPVINSLSGAVEDLKELKSNYKYMQAGVLLDELRIALSGAESGWVWGAADARRQLDELLADGTLEERIATARGAKRDLSSDEGFELVSDEGSPTRVLQRLSDSRHLSCKIEAVLDGVRPADCIMIWREAALYPAWFPFVSGGRMVHEVSEGEIIVHLLIETFFISVDMVLWGYPSDALAETGEMLMCVRPVTSSTRLPPGVTYPERGEGSRSATVFGAFRAKAVIDILVEPLSETSVRFAFQMSDQLPPLLPTWAISYVMQNAMAKIFDRMKEVAATMAIDDPKSEHVKHVTRPSYAPIKEWIERLMNQALQQ